MEQPRLGRARERTSHIVTRRRVLRRAGALGIVALACLVTAATSGGSSSRIAHRSGALAVPHGRISATLVTHGAAAPTDAHCRALGEGPCYSPQEIQTAYGVKSLLDAGDNGAGQTIVIIDSYGSPTLAADLASFDAGYSLPAPPSLQQLSPLGSVPFDVNNDDMTGWAVETTLDVEWAHAMAPAAGIVVLTSPVSETEGVQGLPEFLALEQYALDHHLGQIISQSWGATENTLLDPAGRQVFASYERFYASAALHHVTVLASAGDDGTANQDTVGNIYPFPTVIFPGSSPLVTSVGGTSLYTDTEGNYQSETVWNEGAAGGATGGGISQVFGEPLYQFFLPRPTQKLLGGHRGIPDISWNADPFTPILVYLSFFGPGTEGYYGIGGTSAGSPQWAGLVADLNVLVHRPIGFLNPYLYALGPAGRGFHDIVSGNNAFAGVPGYSAAPGWDAATGWGTPDIGQLFHSIAAMPAMNG
jgi:subtilase family serine protease